MSHHDLPPEKCGMSVTKCHKCGTVLELPALHMRICMLADRADALAGLLRRWMTAQENGAESTQEQRECYDEASKMFAALAKHDAERSGT